jgi:uncharacterized membrane protein
MKKVNLFIIINLAFIGFGAFLFTACRHDTDMTLIKTNICFNNEVLPILQANCAMSGCHSGSGRGVSFSSYQDVLSLVEPGKPYKSQLFKVITSTWLTLMPPSPHNPLTQEQRLAIYLWIEQGATNVCDSNPNNTNTDPNTGTDSVCFANDILPIFVSNCTLSKCHDAITHSKNYNFTDYTNIMARGIVRGSASSSNVYNALRGGGEDRMPPSPRNALTADQISTIGKWMDQGAKNTTCASSCDTTQFTWSGTISKLIQTSCTGCHSGTSPQGKLSLQTYSDVKTIASSGQLISVLYKLNGKSQMPPSNSLTACRKTQFKKWVTAGALNN